jgi:hypothetical protein
MVVSLLVSVVALSKERSVYPYIYIYYIGEERRDKKKRQDMHTAHKKNEEEGEAERRRRKKMVERLARGSK